MKHETYKMGDRFYDPENDRYIEIDSIDIGYKAVMCVVEEYDPELDDYTVYRRQLFWTSELSHLAKVE